MNGILDSGTIYTFSDKKIDVTAASFESMYREYKTTGIVSNELESTETEGIMESTNYRKLNGIFYENGYFLIEGGEIKRFKDEDGNKYFEIMAFEKMVNVVDFYGYLYPFLCNKIYEIVIKGQTVKVLLEGTFIKDVNNFLVRTHNEDSLRAAKHLIDLIKVNDEDYQEKQKEIFMNTINVGEKYVGRVKHVAEKYAILGLTANPDVTLFLHVSKMRNAFISDANLYLYVGQEFEVNVVEVGDNRIQVSTIDMPLCKEDAEYYNAKGEWMHIYALEKAIKTERAKLSTTAMQKTFVGKSEMLQQTAAAIQTVKEKEVNTPNAPINEVADVIGIKTGALSKEAMEKLEFMIQKFGLFKMGMGVEKLLKEFSIDKGLNLMNETEKLLKR